MTTTEQGGPPRLLHNMSSRPRTPVRACLRSQGTCLVKFHLKDPANLDPTTLPTQLDEAWREAGLRGAVLLYALPPAPARKGQKVLRADRLLSINVLGRARGGLLLPGASLLLDPELLERQLATDDPRLVALVAGESS